MKVNGGTITGGPPEPESQSLTIADVQRAATPCPAWEDGRHFYKVRFSLISMVDIKECVCGEAVKRKLWWPIRPAAPEADPR